MDRELSDLEQLLRDARPRPDGQFVGDLRASLLRAAATTPRRRGHLVRVRVILGLAATVALAVFALSLAGLQGFGLRRTAGADANGGRTCVTVQEWKLVREPTFVLDRSGRMAVRYRSQLAVVPRIRCR